MSWKNRTLYRVSIAVFLGMLLFAAGVVVGANQYGKPKTVLHIVTVKWKAGTTQEQIQAAIQGVEKMAREIPGIKNIWLTPIKVQGGMDTAFAMEFESKEALDAYAKHPAHDEWYKVYIPIRERSVTHDLTNE